MRALLSGPSLPESPKRQLIVGLILFTFLAMSPTWTNAEDPPIFVSKWGSSGTGPGQFGQLYSIAVNDSGHVFVPDPDCVRIEKFNRNGTFIMEWGSGGSGDGQFLYCTGVAVSDSGLLTVDENIRVQEFSTVGVFLDSWESPCGPLPFGGSEYFVDTDKDGNVYVSDNGRHCIRKFDENGVLLTSWGSTGSGSGQFSDQHGIAVDDDSGHVFVADTGNLRIQKFTLNGDFLGIVGSSGSGDGQFFAPWGVDVDSLGNLFVADTGNQRIQKLAPDGTFLSKWGSEGTGDGQFQSPRAVVVSPDPNDHSVYVVDYHNRRIQRFTYGSTVGVPEPEAMRRIQMHPAFPNPTRTGSTVAITAGPPLRSGSRVTASVFDASGRRVREIPGLYLTESSYVTWDGRTDHSKRAYPGVYFIRICVDDRFLGIAQVTLLR